MIPQAITPSAILTILRDVIEGSEIFSDLWIQAEVSNYSRSTPGHRYFSLKDSGGVLRSVLFASKMHGFEMKDGDRVLAHGYISIYQQRGELQFVADFVRPEGVGLLAAKYEELKARLDEEGLFDPARKRPLPRFPRIIGVVTSPTGAALQDIKNVLSRRWPLATLVLAPEMARAEGRWCVWTNETIVRPDAPGTLRCYEDLPCVTSTDCSEGRICGGGECIPACTSIRLATDAEGCAERVAFFPRSGMPPNVETDHGDFNPTGVCDFELAVTCGISWSDWERGYIQVEDTFLGALRQRTSAWGAADFDSDTCIDGSDALPCVANPGTCRPRRLPLSCGTLNAGTDPNGTCCFVSGRVTCGDVCEDDEDECSTVRACRPDAVLWSCGPLAAGTGAGACARVEDEFSPVEGLAGYCLFPEFFEGCGMSDPPGADSPCFRFGSAIELNFFEGDCDSDGCPNGYDLAPCVRCDGEFCGVSTRDPRERCHNTRGAEMNIDPSDCSGDAGISDDASINVLADAGITSETDAHIRELMDAGARPTFGGGGGCTCTASSNPSPRIGLLAIGLALAVMKRRRRSAR